MSAVLEARYRAALRWYPRAWRAENADAIVGTLLDQAEADGRSTPLRGELRNLASSGMSRRFESLAPQVVRDRVAAITLAIGFGGALIMFLFGEWAPFATRGPFNQWMSLTPGEYSAPSSVGFGPFASVLVIVYGLWIVAFVLVLLRFSRTAIAALLVTLPVLAWARTLRFDDIGSLQPTTFTLLVFGGLAVLASIGRPARVGRRTLVAVAAASVATAVTWMLAGPITTLHEGRILPSSMLVVLFAPAIGGLLLIAAGIAGAAGRRAWSVSALVAASPWLLFSPLYVGFSFAQGFAIGAGLAGLSLLGAILVWNRLPRATSAPSSRSS